MSSASELVDVLSRVANIFLQAVDALETRMMQIEQRIEDLERGSASSAGYGAPPPGRMAPMPQDTRRAPMPTPQPPPQTQWGGQRQDSYSQPAAPSYQSRPPQYPPQGQSPQPQGYAPQGYSSQGQPPQQGAPQQGPPGPRPPSNPLNIRQAVTGELKDVFARMRARAEGRQ